MKTESSIGTALPEELTLEAIITHRMPLREAAKAYRILDKNDEDCRKVVLMP